ncbi:putative nucleotidyltransferase with HDIG domain [Solibacillus kalamii]|uniref:Metal-dependent phosphohydrolase n=1 Tax=Solibacillus kalamii TaxID=1748298 RepID=A0ABX3ZK16_9BACL|nr:HD-GYP domain-containing protein [Solibacillus kalamii]MBM7664536.1 putative nucleotidyltransferase with HDIG domain [Solibacillus kalamii]OUZ39715.1 metal-dependent phosphohydrolase [Solibacillus kalamii]
MKKSSLLQEEKNSTVLFSWLFYIVFFVYEIFYYNLFPAFPWNNVGANSRVVYDFMYAKYIIIIALIPFSIYLIKKGKVELVKYIVFFGYFSTNLISDILYYKDSALPYTSGNMVELVIILFSPIFVNKKFTYYITGGLILKYILVGLFIQDPLVLFPISIMAVLSFISFLLLHRFLNYIKALKYSYDEQLEGVVKGVIAILELKDPYTRGHSERVAAYAMNMAEATGKFKPSELNNFYYACLLHDIGKVNIPDAILTKSGRLTDDEYDIIKTHPVVGAEAIRDVDGIADNIEVIYHHHERWDGKGYPDGLTGEDIPFLARITAVADAFDAMTSSRSYRPALQIEEAHQRIIDGQGSQFDPQLIEIFKQIYPEWIKISKIYHKGMDMRGGQKRENSQT